MENVIYMFNISTSKKLIRSGVLVFVVLTVFYLLLLGDVFNNIAKKKRLNIILERESQALYATQEANTRKNKDFNLNSFLNLGYVESQKFEVVKTTRNVASIEASRY